MWLVNRTPQVEIIDVRDAGVEAILLGEFYWLHAFGMTVDKYAVAPIMARAGQKVSP